MNSEFPAQVISLITKQTSATAFPFEHPQVSYWATNSKATFPKLLRRFEVNQRQKTVLEGPDN